MSISSLHLDAFVAVMKTGGFSSAAKSIHITQSALSQRILNLEKDLGVTLLIRESSGVRATEFGQRLLRYCRTKDAMESELLESLMQYPDRGLHGVVRIAGFSTVVQSVLIPIVSGLIRENPAVQIEVFSAELRDLPGLLASGRADFIVVSQEFDKEGMICQRIGTEMNVLISPKGKKFRSDVYLDHDEDDTLTYDYLRLQSKKVPRLQRNYFDEIYAIIEAVKHGLGRAVVPLHIARSLPWAEIASHEKPLQIPVYFAYYSLAYYSELQKAVIERISKEAPKYFETSKT